MANIIEKKSLPGIQQLLDDKQLMDAMAKVESPEDLVKVFAEKGATISLEDATTVFNNARDPEYMENIEVGGDELDEDDLENVSGGSITIGTAVVCIGLLYLSACAVAFILGSAWESSLGKKIRKKLGLK